MNFTLTQPTHRAAPVLVEVPHAGLRVPDDVRRSLDAEERDVLRDADAYVHELYARAPTLGATMLVSDISRYVIDLNRDEDDVDVLSVPSRAKMCTHGAPHSLCTHAPRGVIWRESTSGRVVLRRALSDEEFQRRIDRYYQPYHHALSEALRALRARFGFAILLSAHSMPSAGTDANGNATRRADVVPGTRGRSTAHSALVDLVGDHFRVAGLSVRHDDPYRGGATTARWGRPDEGFHAIQVELSRALYMDEQSEHKKRDAFSWIAKLCDELVLRLCEVDAR